MATSNSNHTVGHLNKATTSFVSSKEKEPGTMDLEQLQHMINCTVKKNPKAELSKTDLLRLLGYLEGELQARDVVIATLKTDRVKQMVSHARYGRLLPVNDPFAALQRDSRSATLLGTSTTSSSADDAALLKAVTEGPMAALEAVVTQHRNSHVKLIQAMQDAEARHIKVLGELEDERRKHEHDTAQGDDITYGLEKERTRLREELEIEKQGRKKVDKELKKIQETLEEERARQKQIVLLLLAERKKLICKYVEERNKAEDLAHILSEEKGRVDSMADGLEEESRKALQMEAELEKQLALFDAERAGLRAQLQREEKRAKEMEAIVEKLHAEVDHLKKQQAEAHQVAMFQAGLVHQSPANRISSSTSTVVRNTSLSSSGPAIKTNTTGAPPQTPPRSSSTTTVSSPRASPSSAPLNSATGLVVLGTSSKPIQPVTMVSSTPVQAPTTGIARAVSPATTAGGIRNVQYTLGGVTSGVSTPTVSGRTLPPAPTDSSSDLATTGRGPSNAPVTSGTSPRVAVSASAGTKVFTTTNTDGKVTFHVTTSATLPPASGNSGLLPQQPPTPKKTVVGINSIATRGVPPPVPPNKPVIPPKKSGGGSVQGSGTGPVGLNPTAVATTTASADEGSSGPASSATGGVMLHMGV